MEKKDEERAIEMTGGTAANLAEALDQWENEREMIGQLHDENQAYTIAFRRFDIAIIMAGKVIRRSGAGRGIIFHNQNPQARSSNFESRWPGCKPPAQLPRILKEHSFSGKEETPCQANSHQSSRILLTDASQGKEARKKLTIRFNRGAPGTGIQRESNSQPGQQKQRAAIAHGMGHHPATLPI